MDRNIFLAADEGVAPPGDDPLRLSGHILSLPFKDGRQYTSISCILEACSKPIEMIFR